jgi:hypothetical protein
VESFDVERTTIHGILIRSKSLNETMTGDERDPIRIWDHGCTKYIVNRILSTFPKLIAGAKFDKVFQTDTNRSVISI